MLLAKLANLDTGAQSGEIIICGNCYGNLDVAIGYANEVSSTEIAICEVSDEDVEGVCENCGTKD